MQSGQKIRDYVLVERIGTGGMGEVWRALHTVLHRKVAIKAMDPHLANDPESEQRFIQEARAQAVLHHPRILQVSDFFSEGGVYYLVMPLVDGVPLDKRLTQSRGPLALAEAFKIAHDVLEGLDYAHTHGVIHRDVKPSNILLDASGHAYLLDFGIALMVGQDRRTRTGASLGTPHYMSPEQIQHPKTIDHRADVYSAGCVIYEMLAGRPPFRIPDEDEDSIFAIQQAHVSQIPEPVRQWNPSVPPGIDTAIRRALAKDPDQRWNGCGEFLRALEAHRGGTLFEDPERPLPPLPPQSGKRPLFWVLGSVFGCLALAVLLAVLITANKREPLEETTTPEPPSSLPETPRPSFDCGRARLDVEKMICADGEIARLDVEMADLYHKLYGYQKHLRAEQLSWLKQERNVCRTNECLVQVYQERIAELRSRGVNRP